MFAALDRKELVAGLLTTYSRHNLIAYMPPY
jgi:hypothetical protein